MNIDWILQYQTIKKSLKPFYVINDKIIFNATSSEKGPLIFRENSIVLNILKKKKKSDSQCKKITCNNIFL